MLDKSLKAIYGSIEVCVYMYIYIYRYIHNMIGGHIGVCKKERALLGSLDPIGYVRGYIRIPICVCESQWGHIGVY